MRAAAIILVALALSMAVDGQYQSTPFLLGIALACWLKYRSDQQVRVVGQEDDDPDLPLVERFARRFRPEEGGTDDRTPADHARD